MDDPYKTAWDASYGRLENTLFYPAEEVVRFVNRYIRRRTGVETYSKAFDEKPVFLDVGSGAGRHLVFLWENGFFPVGVELSITACETGQRVPAVARCARDRVQGHLNFVPISGQLDY